MLCNKCQSISFPRGNKELSLHSIMLREYSYQHHSSPSQLEASAREGCEFCAVLFHGLVTHYTNDTSFDPLPLWRGKWSESPVFLTPVRDDREIYTPGMELTA